MTKPLPDTDDWLSKLRLEAFLTWKRTLMVPFSFVGRSPMLQTFSVPVSGAGVAVVDAPRVERDLREHRLRRLDDHELTGPQGYWFVAPHACRCSTASSPTA